MRIKKSASIIHTEMTKTTAIQGKYIAHFPNLNWVSKVLNCASTLGTGVSLVYDYQDLKDAWNDYQHDLHSHQDYGGAALFSVTLQTTLTDVPGMPNWAKILLYPSVPLFDPNPLGWYY